MALAVGSFVFVLVCVPETKGKTLEEVSEMLRANQEPRVRCCGRKKRTLFTVNSRN